MEQRIDERARRFLATAPAGGGKTRLTEFVVFGLKQGWACIFGAALLAVLMAARIWYPDTAGLARNDFLTIAAVVIQILMVAFKLETLRELRVIVLFHLVGTVMELFKTDVGSWSYDAQGFLRIGAVPLFSGFMYAAVGSYMVRVYRLFDLKFAAYPRRWITAVLAAAIYANFFTHHYIWDLRWVLLAAVVLIYGRCVMHFRVFRREFHMPLPVSFLLVALFIWLAENIATWSGAWLYPSQVDGWHPVGLEKLVAWFLLMIISVVLVAWVYKPQPPVAATGGRREAPSSAVLR
ncbi:membrane protein [Arthrobacter sp. NicSoilB11]|nr:membrane protein [Arthrobacter sp. StoSoilB19]BCW77158.1 membrane protein [Arthrobacter sp. NicSoilB11]